MLADGAQVVPAFTHWLRPLYCLPDCRLDTEREFVILMRQHKALSRVDLRQCTGRGAAIMGILKASRAPVGNKDKRETKTNGKQI